LHMLTPSRIGSHNPLTVLKRGLYVQRSQLCLIGVMGENAKMSPSARTAAPPSRTLGAAGSRAEVGLYVPGAVGRSPPWVKGVRAQHRGGRAEKRSSLPSATPREWAGGCQVAAPGRGRGARAGDAQQSFVIGTRRSTSFQPTASCKTIFPRRATSKGRCAPAVKCDAHRKILLRQTFTAPEPGRGPREWRPARSKPIQHRNLLWVEPDARSGQADIYRAGHGSD
jgi:hypothetical protein